MERYNTETYNFIAQDTVNVVSNDVTVYNGLDVYIQIDLDKGCKLWFIKNSNTVTHELKGFFTNFKTKTLVIEWIETIKDFTGALISSKIKSHSEVDTEFFTDFNTLPASTYFHAKQCLNKISQNEIKYICFDKSGGFSPFRS
jgi:hypothetical protein